VTADDSPKTLDELYERLVRENEQDDFDPTELNGWLNIIKAKAIAADFATVQPPHPLADTSDHLRQRVDLRPGPPLLRHRSMEETA